MNEWTVVWHVAIAMLLGGIIGFEREMKNKPAGLRTHMFVCGAATLIVTLSIIALDAYILQYGDKIQSDPLRTFEAIVVGISFIGAGVIMQGKGDVKYITTSASILFTAAIGIAIGFDQFIIAGALTAMAVLVMYAIGAFEHRVLDKIPKKR